MDDRDPVLVVDDDPHIRAPFREVIEAEGLAAACAVDGENALDALHRAGSAHPWPGRSCGSARMQSFPATSADAYKALARTWAATVTVVTTRRTAALVEAGQQELDGFTATAFLTVSMAPPIILVSATTAATAFTMLRDAEAFAVNLLAADRSELAGAFAKPAAERVGLWDRTPWTPDAAGVPLLGGTTGAFSARVRQLVDAGDHTLVLGDVTALHLGEGPDTLVYHNRAYGRVQRLG